jgi:diadenosine tetraphosphate (Ap4A) HIT family hydrolase
MLAAMTTHSKWIAVLCTWTVAGVALADAPHTDKPAPPAKIESAPTPTADQKALARQFRDEREKRVRDRGEIFERIAVKRDYTGEYVLFRDQDVTAFLDLKDPQHPRYKAGHDEEPVTDSSKRRVHILVVPNQPRETIGKTIASDITTEDLELTLKVMHEATALANRLRIKNPKIFVKSPERVGVGYLHVHVVAEVDSKFQYPAAVKDH